MQRYSHLVVDVAPLPPELLRGRDADSHEEVTWPAFARQRHIARAWNPDGHAIFNTYNGNGENQR